MTDSAFMNIHRRSAKPSTPYRPNHKCQRLQHSIGTLSALSIDWAADLCPCYPSSYSSIAPDQGSPRRSFHPVLVVTQPINPQNASSADVTYSPLPLPASQATEHPGVLDPEQPARRRPRRPLRSANRLAFRRQARTEVREGRLGDYLVLRFYWQPVSCWRCIRFQAGHFVSVMSSFFCGVY